MQMRDQAVQNKQESKSRRRSDRGRKKGELPHPGGFFQRREKQGKNACRNHNAGGKAQHAFLEILAHLPPEKKHACGAGSGADKGNQQSQGGLKDKIHVYPSL